MKRLLAIVIVLIFFIGCAQNVATTPILNNISFIANISYGDSEYVADVLITDNALNLNVIAPNELKGLTLNLDKNSVKAKFKGIPIDLEADSLPKVAVYQVMVGVLNDAKQKTAVFDDDNCKVSGDVDGYKYTLIFSPSGLPIELEVEELDLKMKFTNVTVKEGVLE